jgi:hypothetical protein
MEQIVILIVKNRPLPDVSVAIQAFHTFDPPANSRRSASVATIPSHRPRNAKTPPQPRAINSTLRPKMSEQMIITKGSQASFSRPAVLLANTQTRPSTAPQITQKGPKRSQEIGAHSHPPGTAQVIAIKRVRPRLPPVSREASFSWPPRTLMLAKCDARNLWITLCAFAGVVHLAATHAYGTRIRPRAPQRPRSPVPEFFSTTACEIAA